MSSAHHRPGTRLRRALPALVVTAVLALAGCNANPTSSSSASASSQPVRKGGTLTIYSQSSQIDFDPAKSQGLAITSLGLVHRRLTTWDIEPGQEPKVVPDLATDTGRPSDGGRTWTYTLKKGLTFSNGAPITSADIAYGVERSFAPELSGGLAYHKTLLVGGTDYRGPYTGQKLASVETPDDATIVFHLTVPYGDWPWIASMPAFAPVPKSADTDPSTYGKTPVTSGPYEVASNDQGTKAVLKRNPHWGDDDVRGGGPDEIDLLLGQDASVAAQQLISDQGAARSGFGANQVPAAQLAQIDGNPAAKSRLAVSNPGALEYLAMNTRRPALSKPAVRQAIEYAIDKQAFLLAQGGDLAGSVATTLITPGIPGRQQYDLYPASPSGDVAKATSMLAAAGGSKLSLKLVTANDDASTASAEAIAQSLQRVGITISIVPQDENTYADTITGDAGDYDLTVSSWQPDFPSANGNISPLFATSQIGGGNYNLSRYSNPKVDALIAQATGSVDQAAAQKLWAEADRTIMADAPVVPLIYAKNAFLRGSAVANFDVSGFPNYPNYLRVFVNS